MSDDIDPMVYHLTWGTVQCYVHRPGDHETPMFLHFFGRAEYDRNKPVLSESLRKQAEPIVDQLNCGEITEDEAKKALDKIYW